MSCALLWGVAGCTGQLGIFEDGGDSGSESPNGGGGSSSGPGGTNDPLAPICSDVGADVGPTVLRRLSNLEYRLTLEDLFELEAPPLLEDLPRDTNREGFETYAALQTVSAQHLRAYWEAAELLGADLLSDEERAARVIGCNWEDDSCLAGFVERFGKLAFRRPLEAHERDAFVTAAEENALDVPDQYRFVIESVLLSPNFLYRVEIGDEKEGLSTLGPYELASKLSFTLWGRGPNRELLDHAESGALETESGFAEIADAWTEDERTRLFFKAFFEQWLGFAELGPPKEPPEDWHDGILEHMARETHELLDLYAWQGQNFLDVLTTNQTRLSPELASFYGLEGEELASVGWDTSYDFEAGHPRANTGLLSHASLLVAKTDGDRISIRGNWLRHTFLCRHIEIPAEVAEELGDKLVGLTRVEIVRERNVDPACANCHAVIDPIGIGFEQFDATGRFDMTIDVHEFGIQPAFPDAPEPEFETIAELAQKVRALPQVPQCLTQRVFLYTQGRDPTRSDACAVDFAAEDFVDSGSNFRALLRSLVMSPAFRLRRAPTPTP